MNFDKITKRIRPKEGERDNALKLFNHIKTYILESFGKESIIVGSVAKDTFLKEDMDLDIFVFFDPSTPKEILEREGLRIGKSTFNQFGSSYKIAYAEHPYVSGDIEGLPVEIVPCYKVSSGKHIQSAVDRTPFHLEYVMEHLNESQRDDVRLLKKFLKAQKLYGADSRANGFSGYLCELLIIKYNSFANLLAHAIQWEQGVTIDMNEKEKDFEDPLVVVDPVDPTRNVASALSLSTFSRFIEAARAISETKDVRMFSGPRSGYQPVDAGTFFVIMFDIDIIEEVFYAQARKFVEHVVKECGDNGFTLFRHGVFSRGVMLDVEINQLPEKEKHRGPPVEKYAHAEKFKQKHPDVFVEQDVLYTIRERKYVSIDDLINDIIVSQRGLGSSLKRASIRILKDQEAVNAIEKEIIFF
jgi:tRNA nucleotidyltransferase (CCA-adding enzyme)